MTGAGQDYISKSISDRRQTKLFGNLWSEHRVTRYTITAQNKYTVEILKLCDTCPGNFHSDTWAKGMIGRSDWGKENIQQEHKKGLVECVIQSTLNNWNCSSSSENLVKTLIRYEIWYSMNPVVSEIMEYI